MFTRQAREWGPISWEITRDRPEKGEDFFAHRPRSARAVPPWRLRPGAAPRRTGPSRLRNHRRPLRGKVLASRRAA